MKNLLSYESINEAEKELPAMPAFLKTAGAVPEHFHFGGPPTKDPISNAWSVSAKSPDRKETWALFFFPDGAFYTAAGTSSYFKCQGKWKADSASNFEFGNKNIKGVKMEFTQFMVLNPPS